MEPPEGLGELARFFKAQAKKLKAYYTQMRSFLLSVFIVLVTMLCSDCLPKTESPLSLQTFVHELGLHFLRCLGLRWFQAHPLRLGIPSQA